MTTRRGKIARLPLAIRQELNTRLRNGEEGKQLVLWLNSLPAVQEILVAQFKGKAIAECNLSRWRSGGYADWLLEQMAPETRVNEVLGINRETDLFEGPGADSLNEQRQRLREEMAARKAAQQPVAIDPNGA
jgi:hypothetical protein